MEKKFIDVLNCDDNVVTISSLNGKGYTFEPGSVEEPCVIPIPPEEIMYMNSTCSAFKNGVLRFRPEEQNEVFKAIGVKGDDVLFVEDIDEAILNPTVENLQRMIDIKDGAQFERIRGRFYRMTNAGEDLSTKVKRLIDERYKELRAGKRNSELSVVPATKPVDNVQAELEAAKSQLAEMQKQMQAALAQMQSMMAGAQPVPKDSSAEKAVVKRGRKKVEAEKAEVVPAE
jgi:hypothetical protein